MADSAYFVKPTPPRVFGLCSYVTDILKMCNWKFKNGEKIVLINSLTEFLTTSYIK